MEWTLQDRLAQAEEQRRFAAGLPPLADNSPATRAPEAVPRRDLPSAERRRDPDTVVDLRDPANVLTYRRPPAPPATTPAPLASPLPRRGVTMGLPVWQQLGRDTAADPGTTLTEAAPGPVPTRAPIKDRCPRCQAPVRLTRFDLVEATAHMACTECGFQYTAQSPVKA